MRPPEAAKSQNIILSSSIIHKEKIQILICYSGTMIHLFLCKSRYSMYSTTFAFTLLLHTYDMRIQVMKSWYQYLIMCRIYFIAICIGLGYVVGWFSSFSMHILLCLAYEHIAIQYTLFLAINRLVHPFSISIVQTQSPLPSIYTRRIQQNILCISCVHFVHNHYGSSTSPYGQTILNMQ